MADISVTQALSEIKLLRSRIYNGLDDAIFVTLKNKRSDLIDSDKFSSRAKAAF
jgi:hypothetical protein